MCFQQQIPATSVRRVATHGMDTLPIHFLFIHGSDVAPVCSYLVIKTGNYLRESFLTD